MLVRLAELEKANVVGVLTEALAAEVQVVLADQTSTMEANAATQASKQEQES